MRILISITLSFFLVFNLSAQDDNKAPSLKFDLLVNGKKYSVVDGEKIRVGNNEIIVKSSDNLRFRYGSLEFDYPKHFGFDFDEDTAFKNWTLDGNDFVIMYFEFGLEVSLDDFANEMSNQFGQGNVTTSEIKRTLAGYEMEGRKLEVSLLGERLDYEILLVEGNGFKTHLLTFQDSVDEDGAASDEAKNTMDIIDRTLVID